MISYEDIIPGTASTPSASGELELYDKASDMAHVLANVAKGTVAFDLTQNPLDGRVIEASVELMFQGEARTARLRKCCDFLLVTEEAGTYNPILVEFANKWVDPYSGDKFEQLHASLSLVKLYHHAYEHAIYGRNKLGPPRCMLVQHEPNERRTDEVSTTHPLKIHSKYPRCVFPEDEVYGRIFSLHGYGTPGRMLKIASTVIDKDEKLDFDDVLGIPPNDDFI